MRWVDDREKKSGMTIHSYASSLAHPVMRNEGSMLAALTDVAGLACGIIVKMLHRSAWSMENASHTMKARSMPVMLSMQYVII